MPRTICNEKAKAAFWESQRLVLEDEIPQAVDLLESEFTDTWSNSYLPLGNLYIDFPDVEVSDYSRRGASDRTLRRCKEADLRLIQQVK